MLSLNWLSVTVLSSQKGLSNMYTRGPFLESPENFSGPKSHLWKLKKRKITQRFDELNSLRSWDTKGIVTPENGP